MKYKAVVFDVDGTLLDTLEGLLYSVNYSLALYGFQEKDIDTVRRNTGLGVFELIKKSFPSDTDPQELKKAKRLFLDHYDKTCTAGSEPFPGIMDMLDTLQKNGIKMAVASNKAEEAVIRLNDHFFAKYNFPCIGETPEINRKPAPDMIIAAMKALDVTPDETLYVGDSITDYHAATAAGCDCALVTWGFISEDVLRQVEPLFFAHDPKELTSFILNS